MLDLDSFRNGTNTTSDIADRQSGRVRSCSTQMRDFGAVKRFAGTIRTVTCSNDTSDLSSVLSDDGEGRVLVVDGGHSLYAALLDAALADTAAAHNWSGVIVNGVVRDSARLAHVVIGIKAIGTNPRRAPARGSNGRVDETVAFGGVSFVPGEMVYCDEDGIVVDDGAP